MKRNSTPYDHDQYTASRYRVVQRVAPGLTHELRGPLNALNLNIELLKMTQDAVDEKGVEKRKRYVSVVAGELERFQGLFERFVEQVLGGDTDEPERFDLRQLVDEVHEMVSVQVRKEGVRLTAETGDEPLPIRVHRGRLRQAVLIAVVSALDALESTPGEKTMTLGVGSSGEVARLTVADSSPADGERRSEESLELARALVESQGTRWSFETVPGDGGSEVKMEIPLAED